VVFIVIAFIISPLFSGVFKMKPVVDLDKCTGCGACVAVCPASPTVFEMKDVEEAGTKSTVKHPDACIGCNSCVTACPVEAIKLVDGEEE